MFTGIIEELGEVKKIRKEGLNLLITIQSDFANELKINQSIGHDGICLSVLNKNENEYTVCAIKETIEKTNIKSIEVGAFMNLERSLILGDRLDGHIVQGHVDCAVKCIDIIELDGSWKFTFECPQAYKQYLIPKGSIAVNGVSLTIADIDDTKNTFSVAIIPYTFQKTNFKYLKKIKYANVEFDLITKQIARMQNR